MAGLLDGVIIKFSKGIESSDHLVVIGGIRRSVAKHVDAPEHERRGTADGCLNWVLDRLLVRTFVFGGHYCLGQLKRCDRRHRGSLHHRHR